MKNAITSFAMANHFGSDCFRIFRVNDTLYWYGMEGTKEECIAYVKEKVHERNVKRSMDIIETLFISNFPRLTHYELCDSIYFSELRGMRKLTKVIIMKNLYRCPAVIDTIVYNGHNRLASVVREHYRHYSMQLEKVARKRGM